MEADSETWASQKREYTGAALDPTAQRGRRALRARFGWGGDGKLPAADTDFVKFKVMVTGADGSKTVQTLTALGITEINLTEDATNITLRLFSEFRSQRKVNNEKPGKTLIVAASILSQAYWLIYLRRELKVHLQSKFILPLATAIILLSFSSSVLFSETKQTVLTGCQDLNKILTEMYKIDMEKRGITIWIKKSKLNNKNNSYIVADERKCWTKFQASSYGFTKWENFRTLDPRESENPIDFPLSTREYISKIGLITLDKCKNKPDETTANLEISPLLQCWLDSGGKVFSKGLSFQFRLAEHAGLVDLFVDTHEGRIVGLGQTTEFEGKEIRSNIQAP